METKNLTKLNTDFYLGIKKGQEPFILAKIDDVEILITNQHTTSPFINLYYVVVAEFADKARLQNYAQLKGVTVDLILSFEKLEELLGKIVVYQDKLSYKRHYLKEHKSYLEEQLDGINKKLNDLAKEKIDRIDKILNDLN